MGKFKQKYRSKSNRMPQYDYSSAGFYYVTICTKGMVCSFGEIPGDQMKLSNIGVVVEQNWQKIVSHFENVRLDEFIIMPNHLHGIINITQGNDVCGYQLRRDAINRVSTELVATKGVGGVTGLKNPMLYQTCLGRIVRWFKGRCTYEIRKELNPVFSWQSNYYEHIIRSEYDLDIVRQYIIDNPTKFHESTD